VRAAYYGEEVMRLQRGRHEVKLMVRYPPGSAAVPGRFREHPCPHGRRSRAADHELAEMEVTKGYSEINRRDQHRSITISADVQGERQRA
jgi:hydrophobic/amphiphilic exporter-1 (mainly G- bacteria), HAE1 family